MKRIILFLLILIPFLSNAQNVAGNELRIYEKASIGEDGVIYPLDMNGNKVINVQDPTGGKDALNLDYFNANALSAGMIFDSIMWNTNITNLTVEKGKLYLDSVFQALRYSPDGINSIFLGRMLLNPLVINNTGVLIENLKVVYIDGEFSGKLSIQLADKSTFDKSRIVGVTTEPIINGQTGNVTRFGLIEGNTTGLYIGAAAGDMVYLDNNGGLTSDVATGGDFNIFIGLIKKLGVSDGQLYVNPNIEDFTAEILSPRGWSADVVASTTLAPNSGLLTFNIIGTGYVYENGIKYPFDNPSVIWDDTEGTVDVYFDEGVLTTAANQTESQVRDIYSSKAGVSRMYWDALNDTLIFANDMRHTFDMNGNTWATLWDYHKCVVLDGLGLVDIQTEGTGNVDADAQFGHGSGVIRNQDIITSIPAVASTTGYTVFYREGVTEWRSENSIGFPVLTTGTGRVAWNEDIAGTWQQTEVANGDFVLYHLFVSNTLGDKTGTVMGQNDYASLAGARSGALTEVQDLLFSQFPIEELSPVATVIFETRLNYTNGVQARTRQSTDPVTGDLVDYIDWTRTDVAGGGGGGTGASSFDDLSDTPAVKTGSAGLGVIVNPTEDALIYAEVARTINGESPTSGNYNITSTANKIAEDVTIGTGGTGIDAVFSVADNDSDPTNENQDLSNTKLNNTVTVDISNGTSTTLTEIARTDFLNSAINSASYSLNGVNINSGGLSNVAYLDLASLFSGLNFMPINIERTNAAAVTLGFKHTGGQMYLGSDGLNDLKWGSSTNATLNPLIYHSENINTSSIDFNAKDITATGTVTAPTAKLTTGAVVDKVWTCTNVDGSGNWDDALASTLTLQDATDNGASTTNDISISKSLSVGGVMFSTDGIETGDLITTTGCILMTYQTSTDDGYLVSQDYSTSTEKKLHLVGSQILADVGGSNRLDVDADRVTITDILNVKPSIRTLTPSNGDVYNDSSDNHLYFYNGTIWVQLDN